MAYEGTWINENKTIATLCGNLTNTLPVLKSTGNTMTVTFYSDDSRHFKGFNALVLFTKSIASGCGGNITVQNTRSWQTQTGTNYDSFEDCFWTMTAPTGSMIQMTITHMDVKNTPNKTASPNTEPCNGDFLEVITIFDNYFFNFIIMVFTK